MVTFEAIRDRESRVAVVGLGYVGLPLAVALARHFDVLGFDISARRVEELKGGSYRNMWWVLHNDHGAYSARGVHGQRVYVDPKAEMVIVRFASHPVAGNAANDPTTIPAFDAVANLLMSAPR